MGLTALMVAEKPSLAESIAKILSDGKYTTRRSVALPVHEYDGVLFGKQINFKVTSVTGHVFGTDFPKEYNSWDKVDAKDLFTAPVMKLESNPKQHIVKHLSVEAKNVDYLILWLDCDREGENICFEVIKCTQSHMNKDKEGRFNKRNILRARFSAITTQEIKKAMKSLVKPNENEAKAVDVRQELDLKIGCAFTRYQTRFFQGKYGNLDSSLVSFGPCQTPTLALCVQRHDEILSFVPKPYWSLQARVDIDGHMISLASERGRIFEKKKANELKNSLLSVSKAEVIEVSSEKKSTQRPHALNTVELLRAASAGLGIAPHETMSIAERLYIQGYISYPRTETTKYPDTFDLKSVVESFKQHSSWGNFAKDLLNAGIKLPEGGTDCGDHPPITPTGVAFEHELGGNSWRVYDYIVRHFLGSIMPNQQYLRTKLTVAIKNGGNSELFSWSGNRVLNPGFTSVMHWKAMSNDLLPIDIQKGALFDLVDVGAKEAMTTPPPYLTESDLIQTMEKLGIGTDASMAVHINNICQRRYVQVQDSQRSLVPTNLGIVLIHGLQAIDPQLAQPTLRATMEKQIALIAAGKAKFDQVLNSEIQVFAEKFDNFVTNIEKMDILFEATFSPMASSGRPLSKCGKCRRYMHYIALRPARLHCRTCNETYTLPAQGTIKLYKELKCPLDQFELVLFSTGSKGRGYPICPQCYNHPPFEEADSPMGCNNCPDETCPHSMTTNWISPCSQEECLGVLVLDATSAPRWKLGCNKCNLVTAFSDIVNDVKVEKDSCQECGSRLAHLSFLKKEGKEDIRGCVMCDEKFEGLLETKVIRSNRYRKGGGSRGRGKSRGGKRGRGRSRGRGGRDSGPIAKPSQSRSLADFF